ncbi:HEAT repeat domain-containing protein [candidate division KSB1 bacterium]
MLSNDDQRQLDNLKSQVPILSQRIQNFVTEINEIAHREGGNITKRKIEELTAQAIIYQERMKKIEQAITLVMKIRGEKEAEEEQKSEAEQRERTEQERTIADQKARKKVKQEKLKQETATKPSLRGKKREEHVKHGIDEETTAKEAESLGIHRFVGEQDSEHINKIEQITPQPEEYRSFEEDVVKHSAFDSLLDKALFNQASSKLYDKRKEVRCEGVREMEQLGYKSNVVIPALVKILDDKESDVRVQALESLINLEAKETVPKFVESLSDENVRVRFGALRGLYKLAGKSAAPLLVRALRDENIEVRNHAATYLGWSCGYAAVPGLIRLIDSPDASLRKAWIQAISGIRDRSTIPYIISVLDDPRADIRRLAALALYKWTGETFGFKANNKKSDREHAIAEWKEWWSRNKDTFQIKLQADEIIKVAKKVKKRPKRVKKSIMEPKEEGIEKQKLVGKRQKSKKRKAQKQKPEGIRKLDIGALVKYNGK